MVGRLVSGTERLAQALKEVPKKVAASKAEARAKAKAAVAKKPARAKRKTA